MKWWSWLNLVALNYYYYYYYYWNIPIEVYPTISPSELEFWICTAVMISDVQYWEVPTGRGRIHNLRSAIPCGPCVWPGIELSRTRKDPVSFFLLCNTRLRWHLWLWYELELRCRPMPFLARPGCHHFPICFVNAVLFDFGMTIFSDLKPETS